MENTGRIATLVADAGSGQVVDVELGEPNTCWLAVGSGIEVADIWIKHVAGTIDLRVRILRLGNAIEIAVDRGDQSRRWWPLDATPRLLFTIDKAVGVARATVSVGAGDDVKTIEIGLISY